MRDKSHFLGAPFDVIREIREEDASELISQPVYNSLEASEYATFQSLLGGEHRNSHSMMAKRAKNGRSTTITDKYGPQKRL